MERDSATWRLMVRAIHAQMALLVRWRAFNRQNFFKGKRISQNDANLRKNVYATTILQLHAHPSTSDVVVIHEEPGHGFTGQASGAARKQTSDVVSHDR